MVRLLYIAFALFSFVLWVERFALHPQHNRVFVKDALQSQKFYPKRGFYF